ncbi:MAG: HYR domain-containing protein [Frankiaceae bacterium]|nr:HYR domain-containing protein [Frankiaceae bacterium]
MTALAAILAFGWSYVRAADSTGPTITAYTTGHPGLNGWFTSPVELSWAITDPGRQVNRAATQCLAVRLSGDTPPTPFTCTAALTNGTTISKTVVVKVDGTAPQVSCPSPPPIFALGQKDAQVSATVVDSGSGALVTSGGKAQAAPPNTPAQIDSAVDASAPGSFTVPVTGFDVAGNTATASCAFSVISDSSAPTATGTVTGQLGANGWYTGDATPSFAIASATTAVAEGCNPAPVTEDTAGVTFNCTVTSGSGTTSASLTVKRDATPPVVTCPAPPEIIQGNAATITATVADDTSGPVAAKVSAPVEDLSVGEHTVTITGADLAGNTASAQCAYTVAPDKAPVVTPEVTGLTGAGAGVGAGVGGASTTQPPTPITWYTGDVTVRWNIDAASPVTTDGCDPATITEDTPGQTLTCTATSSGGTTTQTVTVARDATAPTLACPAPMPSFVNGTTAQLTAAVADATSGVAADTVSVPADTSQVGLRTAAVSVADLAGNTTTGQCGYQVEPDTTPPVIHPTVDGTLGANGWYTGTVSVSFSVHDPDSPITAAAGCDARTISADTKGTTITCTATSYGGTDSQTVVIKRDATPPTMSCTSGDFVQGATGLSTASTSDETSGAWPPQVQVPADTTDLGTHTVPLTGTDQAGNTQTVDCEYTVLPIAAVKAARLSRTGQNIMPQLLIAGFLVVTGTIGLTLTIRSRTAGQPAGKAAKATRTGGRHSTRARARRNRESDRSS